MAQARHGLAGGGRMGGWQPRGSSAMAVGSQGVLGLTWWLLLSHRLGGHRNLSAHARPARTGSFVTTVWASAGRSSPTVRRQAGARAGYDAVSWGQLRPVQAWQDGVAGNSATGPSDRGLEVPSVGGGAER